MEYLRHGYIWRDNVPPSIVRRAEIDELPPKDHALCLCILLDCDAKRTRGFYECHCDRLLLKAGFEPLTHRFRIKRELRALPRETLAKMATDALGRFAYEMTRRNAREVEQAVYAFAGTLSDSL